MYLDGSVVAQFEFVREGHGFRGCGKIAGAPS
jgi:hypothetical protein